MPFEFFTREQLTPVLAHEIAAFLDTQSTSHPFQFPQWSGPNSRLALVRENGKIRWFANCSNQYPLGTRLHSVRALNINRGPVCDDPAFWRSTLAEFAREVHAQRFVYLDIAPERVGTSTPASVICNVGWTPLGKSRHSLRLSLAGTEDEILAGFRKNTRYDVRRSERAGVNVQSAEQQSDIEQFLDLYSRLGGRKGFATDPQDHVSGIIQWLIAEPARGALLLARHHGTLAAGVVIVRAGSRCWYVWGASDKHDGFSAGHLLQWRAILWARSHGCTEYDFGGYTPGATSGPAWFKEGFGGQIVSFPPAQRYIFRPRLYRLLQLARKFR